MGDQESSTDEERAIGVDSEEPPPEVFPQGSGLQLLVGEREGKTLLLVCGVVAFGLALGVSYLDEDAFISFRVVDNFVKGYGLRWNVAERVQVFTNPLWVLALSVLQAMIGNIAWTSYLLSAAATTAALLVLARPLQRRPALLALLFLPLLLSQAFTDYTSSGLENPFIYLFSALFLERLFRPGAWELAHLGASFRFLALMAALCATSRADTFLLFAPVLLWLCVEHRRQLPWGQILLGASPLLLWLAFAYLYYGTIFPNPKYAKLDGGIERAVYLKFGWTYLMDMARNDVVTFAGLLAAPALTLGGLLRGAAGRSAAAPSGIGRPTVLLGLGASLYIGYVVWVGGDFMAGRHWATPFFFTVAAGVLRLAELMGALEEDPHAQDEAQRLSALGGSRFTKEVLYGTAALVGLRFVVQPITEERDVIARREQDRFAIVREGEIRVQRFNCGFYEALFSKRGDPSMHSWSQDGTKEARRAAILIEREPDKRYVVVNSAAGKGPFYAGPLVDYVDPLGITDPLLARLPDADGQMELIGHLKRRIPRGYVDARADGDASKMDPHLRKYWEALSLVTRGPVFDRQRLETLVRMTGGAYDELLQHYVDHGERKQEQRIMYSPHGHF